MRSLRIGVVIAGKLVEERVFPPTRPITLGQSLRCALSVPVEGVPREHLLFARDEGAFVLHVAPQMIARVGIGDRIEAVTDTLRLAPGARGKLVLGDLTLLFQDVATVVRPKPQLPASLRARPIDRRLALIIGLSLCVHIGIAAWAWNADVEHSVLGMRDLPSEFRQETIDVQLPDFTDHVDPTQTPTTMPAIARPVAPQHHIVQPTRPLPSDPEQLARDASRMASILTGDDGSHGFGGMNHRQPGADLARQMDDAQHRVVTIGDNGHTSRVDDRARVGTGHDLHIDQPDAMIPADTEHHDRAGTSRIVIQPLPGEGDRTTLTPQSVLDKIQSAYVTGLQRCYRLGQNEDASLEGKIKIEFTVDDHGRVAEPAAEGLTPKVDSCVQHFMSSWHFGIPKDKDGAATDATFKIALVLKKS
ncbi:MAG: AgmX/PglI C-terminal domain-containing protein [Deltaproteobacteria bacterium]